MRSRPAVVVAVEELAPGVVQLKVAPSGPFDFQAGQWVNFHFPDGISRAYTIASAPDDEETIELCVRIGSGRGGAAVATLHAGTAVTLDGPFGDFLLPDGDERPVVFLAGDTGIAPVRSIVLHMLATHDPREIFVLYEPNHRNILYAADFDPLARSGIIVHESGPIETLILRKRRAIQRARVMAAGFDPFLQRVRKSVSEIGVEGSSVIAESFGAEP